jgi:hypothetical protein
MQKAERLDLINVRRTETIVETHEGTVFGKFQRLRQNTMRPANDQQPKGIHSWCVPDCDRCLRRSSLSCLFQANQKSTFNAVNVSVSLRYVNFQPSIPAKALLTFVRPLASLWIKGDIYLSHSTSSSSFPHRSTVIALKLIIVVDIHVSHHLSRTKTTQRDGRDL